jgi:hypothetical protein
MSTENLLDVDIDHQLELSNADARRLFASIGPLSVDVPVEVRTDAGHDRERLLFSPGRQVLSPASLVALLYISGIDGDDTDVATRHLAFWDALVDAFSSDPAALEAAVAGAGGAVDDSDVGAQDNAHLLGAVVGTDARGLTLGMLPVREIGAGTSRLYQVDSETAGDVLEGVARAPDADAASPERVQVLNGNGAPGIGESVGRRLVRAGFKVMLSGNARRLNHGLTRVVTYDASPTGLAAARRIRGLLGVGRVQISPQTQGIVNLTVVVGKDFLRRQ